MQQLQQQASNTTIQWNKSTRHLKSANPIELAQVPLQEQNERHITEENGKF